MLTTITLSLGSIMMLSIVPRILTIGTLIIVIFLVLSLFLIHRYKSIRYILLILAVLAITASSLSPAHLQALREFGQSPYISMLDVLMVLSFYIGPILYIIALLRDNLKR